MAPADASARQTRALVLIPVYNHAASLRAVVEQVLQIYPHVLVVNDGSTEAALCADITSPQHPLHGLPVELVSYTPNRGKGYALVQGANKARELGFSHIITMDADGQHKASDLPKFLQAIAADAHTIYVGSRDFTVANVPGSSKFGRAFSNFWFQLQTGQSLADTQSGFRAYPVSVFSCIQCRETRYSFEVEVLVRAAWGGFAVADIPIDVYYPPKAERISHFKAFKDNLHISLLNTRLTMRCFMPVPHKKFIRNKQGGLTILRPLASLRMLLLQEETPFRLACAAAMGVFIGALPLIGLHSMLIIVCAGLFRLHGLMALAASQLCMPPFMPALCIELGFFMRNGSFLTDVSWQNFGREALARLYEWGLGSLVVAPALACGMFALVYLCARAIQYTLSPKTDSEETEHEMVQQELGQ